MAKQAIENEEILFQGVLKWLILSTLCGVIVAVAVGTFLIVLYKGIDFVYGLGTWKYVLIPAGLLASLYSIKIFAPDAAGHGTDKVIDAIHYKAALIPFSVVPVKIISTLFTLIPGAVVGTEGPSVQIGAALMSEMSKIFKLSVKERKKLVICGVSAALSSVFGAPVAGAVFGVEVLFVGEIFYPVLLPAFISAIMAYMVCLNLGVPYGLPVPLIPDLDFVMSGWCVLASFFFGLICIFHIEFTHFIARIFNGIVLPDWAKSLIASSLILIVVAFSGEEFLGMGERGLQRVLSGESLVGYAFLIKSFLLAVTLSGGGSGGVLTPTFYIGAAAGALFASVFGLNIAFFGALGFIGCIAGSVNTPIAATFLAVELFGASIAPFAGIVCIITYMISGARSLYPTQILIRPKSDDFVLADPLDKKSWQVKPVKDKSEK